MKCTIYDYTFCERFFFHCWQILKSLYMTFYFLQGELYKHAQNNVVMENVLFDSN